MSAMYSVEHDPGPRRHPLAKGASPEAIRSALLPEDQPEFDAAYDAALAEARTRRDLTGLFQMLERWRGIAARQADPHVFRRVARRAVETLTGQPSPEDEPLAVTRAKGRHVGARTRATTTSPTSSTTSQPKRLPRSPSCG